MFDTSNRSHRYHCKAARIRNRTFADETTTGKVRVSLRGPFQATIAARAEGDFEWWERIVHDFFPGNQEIKSEAILLAMKTNGQLREAVHQGVASSVIAVIDFSEYTRQLVHATYDLFQLESPPNPLDILRDRRLPPKTARSMLTFAKENYVAFSAIPRVEWLLRLAAESGPFIIDEPAEFFAGPSLKKLTDKQFKQLSARFALAFGDALDPIHQAEALRSLIETRYVDHGQIAYTSLEATIIPDRVYDEGDRRVFEMLRGAHGMIAAVLEEARTGWINRSSSAGLLAEEDSKNYPGLQVADVAAGLAREEYERTNGNIETRSTALTKVFSRVLVNDTWLDS